MSVLGPNGAGKSTLFRCVLGLLKSYTGSICVDGWDIQPMEAKHLARLIAYVPQTHYTAFNYSVLDMVLMGLTPRLKAFASPGRSAQHQALEAIERLGIRALADRIFSQLSGGEQQLTLIARALAQQTRLLILDEPSASLDFGNQLRVMKQLRTLADEGYTILLSTHHPNQAYLYSDLLLILAEGRVDACGSPQEVLTDTIAARLYGKDIQVHSLCGDRARVCLPAEYAKTSCHGEKEV